LIVFFCERIGDRIGRLQTEQELLNFEFNFGWFSHPLILPDFRVLAET